MISRSLLWLFIGGGAFVLVCAWFVIIERRTAERAALFAKRHELRSIDGAPITRTSNLAGKIGPLKLEIRHEKEFVAPRGHRAIIVFQLALPSKERWLLQRQKGRYMPHARAAPDGMKRGELTGPLAQWYTLWVPSGCGSATEDLQRARQDADPAFNAYVDAQERIIKKRCEPTKTPPSIATSSLIDTLVNFWALEELELTGDELLLRVEGDLGTTDVLEQTWNILEAAKAEWRID